MIARDKFFIGQAVKTTKEGHLLKGQTERTGNVVGFGERLDYVRVSWAGWKTTSSVTVHMNDVHDLLEDTNASL